MPQAMNSIQIDALPILGRYALALCLAATTAMAGVPNAHQLPWTSAQEGGQPTTLTATGPIAVVDRSGGRVFLTPTKPFWAPPPSGRNRIIQWPADTLFVVRVSAVIPITIDGKRAGFTQLAIGQNMNVQYELSQGFYGGVSCVALRIDARTASPPKKETPPAPARKK
jgi:hypothetical protein